MKLETLLWKVFTPVIVVCGIIQIACAIHTARTCKGTTRQVGSMLICEKKK